MSIDKINTQSFSLLLNLFSTNFVSYLRKNGEKKSYVRTYTSSKCTYTIIL